jgi:hypothetical protein
MTDSIQKIVEDARELAQRIATDNINGHGNAVSSIADRLEALNQWQPIESAPKDGTEILVVGGTFDYDGSYYNESNRPVFTGISMARWKDLREAFVAPNGNGHDEEFYYYPTLWMPLPSPPEPSK